MPIIDDPRYTESAIVGPVRPDLLGARAAPEEPGPGALDVLAAASRQATLSGAGWERFINSDPDGPDAPPGYDALDHITGYEDEASRFIDATTPAEVEGIKARIQSERADRDVLRRAGVGGTAAQMAMGVLEPSFLVSLAVPELAVARGARLVTGAVRGAVGAGAYELGMHSVQEGRTLEESGINIAAGALLSGVLGGLARRVPPEELNVVREAARADITAPIRSETGAAAARRETTLEAESIARGGRWLAKAFGKVPFAQTDLQVVMQSQSVAAREVLQDLADVAPILTKNEAGIATPTSVESLVARREGAVADFVDFLRDQWKAYRERVPSGERMKREDFQAAVTAAARRGDKSAVPEIEAGAKFMRERGFDPLKAEAQKLGLLPADVQVVGAESYVRRLYSRDAIRANRREWDSILTKHFMRQGVDYAEARSVAEDVTRRILGADVGQANFNIRTHVPSAGPLHERVLDIPDELIEPFLEADPVKILSSYVRELAPEIEITKRFGDREMKDAFDLVRQEYDVMRERVRQNNLRSNASPLLTKLEAEERRTLDALTRIRDRVYGRAGRIAPDASEGTRRAVEVLRGWRNLVASGRLGMAALTSWATDTARIVAQYGFAPTVGKMVKLATSSEFRDLSRAQARRIGAAVEVAMARRVTVAFDGAVTEGWTQALANSVYKYSGLNHWTDIGRTLSVTLLEDSVLKAASETAAGKTLPAWTRTRLASLGLDDNALSRIHAEASKHGGEIGGVRVSGSGNWDDANLSAIYDAALLKESRMTVMQPGAADRTWWMDKETGRVVGQLKSFALATPLRLTVTPFQMVGQGQYLQAARFVGAMMVGGYLAHALRQLASGKQPATDLKSASFEAFSEAGLAGIVPDLVAPIGRRFGVLGESARYSDRNVLSTFGGPALGTVGDAYDLLMNRSSNGISAKDLHLIRRLLPMQNLWLMRRAINALEGEAAEAMGLEGADAQTFGQRFMETTPLLPTGQRGGTGTGRLVQ